MAAPIFFFPIFGARHVGRASQSRKAGACGACCTNSAPRRARARPGARDADRPPSRPAHLSLACRPLVIGGVQFLSAPPATPRQPARRPPPRDHVGPRLRPRGAEEARLPDDARVLDAPGHQEPRLADEPLRLEAQGRRHPHHQPGEDVREAHDGRPHHRRHRAPGRRVRDLGAAVRAALDPQVRPVHGRHADRRPLHARHVHQPDHQEVHGAAHPPRHRPAHRPPADRRGARPESAAGGPKAGKAPGASAAQAGRTPPLTRAAPAPFPARRRPT